MEVRGKPSEISWKVTVTLASGTRLGAYEIVGLAGAGGMGEVYRARDIRLARTVAIKILTPRTNENLRAQFESEAQTLSQLNHPRICTLYDIGHDDGLDFAVIEYLEGETLAERLATRPMRLDQVLRCAAEIAEGLDAAHRLGFTHGDLKPANIMLTAAGVKLLDFGLATRRQYDPRPRVPTSPELPCPRATPDPTTATATIDDVIVGSVPYMAPEQIEGGPFDTRADLFAFGAVLYEMIARRRAFEGDDVSAVFTTILEHDPPALIRCGKEPVPPALNRVVSRALAKDPDERWQSAGDLASELRWIGQTLAQTPVNESSRRRVWVAGGVALLMVIAAATLLTREWRAPAGPIAGMQGVRFEVPPPEGTTLSPSASMLSISPDGRRLAFLASRPGAAIHIWVRDLDSVAARELPGTDGALGPFWSPDGRRIAFFANDQVKTVGLFGEPPVVIADLTVNIPAGTWNRNDDILLSGRRGIVRLSARDGPMATTPSVVASRPEIGGTIPNFLPDGRHFLCLVRETEDPRHNWIVVRTLDSPEEKRLLSAGSQAFYVDPGYLMFVREGSLVAQQFDLDGLRMVGEPVPVGNVDHIGLNPNNLRAMLSVSRNGVVAFRAEGVRELSWFDRAGQSLGTIGEDGYDLEPVISPEGHRLAVSRYDPRWGTKDIWIFDLLRGGAGSRLTHQRRASSPIWSADGLSILFACGTEPEREICEQAVGSSADARALGIAGVPYDHSPDGSIVFGSPGLGTGTSDLWMTRAGAPPVRLTDTTFSERQAQISPNGRWIAYSSDVTGKDEIYVRAYPKTDTARKVSLSGGIEPQWRRDGRELFWLGADRRLMSVSVDTTGTFHSGTPAALFQTTMDPTGRLGVIGRSQYAVAPNGQRFLINQTPAHAAPPPITVIVNWRPPS
jgi:dipeptidyl aminopeptidase/acylaminoacyl peptidase